MNVDLVGAFFGIRAFFGIDNHVIHKENVFQYIHVNIKEYNHEKIRTFR